MYSEEEMIDMEVDMAKEQAKEDRHTAVHHIEITGTEANLVMNHLQLGFGKPGCPADLELQALRQKFWNLYFFGKFDYIAKEN